VLSSYCSALSSGAFDFTAAVVAGAASGDGCRNPTCPVGDDNGDSAGGVSAFGGAAGLLEIVDAVPTIEGSSSSAMFPSTGTAVTKGTTPDTLARRAASTDTVADAQSRLSTALNASRKRRTTMLSSSPLSSPQPRLLLPPGTSHSKILRARGQGINPSLGEAAPAATQSRAADSRARPTTIVLPRWRRQVAQKRIASAAVRAVLTKRARAAGSGTVAKASPEAAAEEVAAAPTFADARSGGMQSRKRVCKSAAETWRKAMSMQAAPKARASTDECDECVAGADEWVRSLVEARVASVLVAIAVAVAGSITMRRRALLVDPATD